MPRCGLTPSRSNLRLPAIPRAYICSPRPDVSRRASRFRRAQVGALLDLMAEMVEVVIVDIGRHINDTSVVVWERCDQLLYVLDQSVAAMRGAWRFLDLFGRLICPARSPGSCSTAGSRAIPLVKSTLSIPWAARSLDASRATTRRWRKLWCAEKTLWKVAPRSPLTRSYEIAGPPNRRTVWRTSQTQPLPVENFLPQRRPSAELNHDAKRAY